MFLRIQFFNILHMHNSIKETGKMNLSIRNNIYELRTSRAKKKNVEEENELINKNKKLKIKEERNREQNKIKTSQRSALLIFIHFYISRSFRSYSIANAHLT